MTSTNATSLLDLLALPMLLILSSLVGWVCVRSATYLEVTMHNALLARLVGALGRAAGDIHAQLTTLSPGANLLTVRNMLVQQGVMEVAGRLPETLAALGQPDHTVLEGMLVGELGKLAAQTTSPLRIDSGARR